MAYTLGFLYADGHLIDAPKMRGQYICFTNTDKDRVECFRELMESDHTITERVQTTNRKAAYQLRIGSKVLYQKLTELGLTPNKSHTVLFPDVPRKYLGSFIRGYFDGDGCVFLERGPTGRPKRLLTIFTCGSSQFLAELHRLLATVAGLQGTRMYKHGSVTGAYQLRYSTRNSLRLFTYMYSVDLQQGLYLRRKYDIFVKYLEMRNISREDIPFLLETKGPVVNRKHDALQKRYSAGSTPAWASK